MLILQVYQKSNLAEPTTYAYCMTIMQHQAALALIIVPVCIIGIFALNQYVHRPQQTPYTLTPLPTTQVASASSVPKDKERKLTKTTASSTAALATSGVIQSQPTPLATYFEITEGCSISVDETCAKAHKEPSASSTKRADLRVGTLLRIAKSTTTASGELWYEVAFPEHLRYPERLTLPWYVPATAGEVIRTPGPEELSPTTPPTNKRLVVDRVAKIMSAYAGDELVATYTISTGRDLTPTPRGTFTIFRKTPSRYMQGPIPGISTNYYDLPGVPWNLYFTAEGAIVHGAYWHDAFGQQRSNGCVNVPLRDARRVYEWADLGTLVVVN
jgi:lipoprotein-anchoring transpeptidase ErfK/SrfK